MYCFICGKEIKDEHYVIGRDSNGTPELYCESTPDFV